MRTTLHHVGIVVNRVDDAVVANPNAPGSDADQLPAADRPRIAPPSPAVQPPLAASLRTPILQSPYGRQGSDGPHNPCSRSTSARNTRSPLASAALASATARANSASRSSRASSSSIHQGVVCFDVNEHAAGVPVLRDDDRLAPAAEERVQRLAHLGDRHGVNGHHSCHGRALPDRYPLVPVMVPVYQTRLENAIGLGEDQTTSAASAEGTRRRARVAEVTALPLHSVRQTCYNPPVPGATPAPRQEALPMPLGLVAVRPAPDPGPRPAGRATAPHPRPPQPRPVA